MPVSWTDVIDDVDDVMAVHVNTLYHEMKTGTPQAYYANTETLAATKTLVDADLPIQYLNCDGAARQVNLPAVAATNHAYWICNTSAGAYDITVKNAGGTTIGVVSQVETKMFLSDGATWKRLGADKATGAELITGTDDAKFATAKALKDGGFVPVKLIGGVPHRQLWIGNAKPTLTLGCSASAQIEMGTNKNVYDYLSFGKAAVSYAYANVPMPDAYTGGVIYANFKWLHPATTTNFKVSWGLSAVSFSDDDTLDAAQGTPQYGNDTGGTTSDFYISPTTAAITIAGTPIAGDYINFRISRLTTDGTNDTLAVAAYLLGVMVWYPVA
jgi:hypothetical protein